MDGDLRQLLGRDAAAKFLSDLGVPVSPRTLEDWRRKGRGPALHRVEGRVEGRVFYAVEDLLDFIRGSRRRGSRSARR